MTTEISIPGQITLQKGSKIVTGVGTNFTVLGGVGNFKERYSLKVVGAASTAKDWKKLRNFPIDSVQSATQLTLADPWPFESLSTLAYRFRDSRIHRNDIYSQIQELISEASSPPPGAVSGPYHQSNWGALPQIGGVRLVNSSNFGPNVIKLIDFMRFNDDLESANAVDTIVRTAYDCTRIRKFIYGWITYQNNETPVFDPTTGEIIDQSVTSVSIDEGISEVHWGYLDFHARIWYEDFDDPGRVFNIVPGASANESLLRIMDNLSSGSTSPWQPDQNQIQSLMEAMRHIIRYHKEKAPVLDLRTCHGNCHSNCHSSRNRR